jgi:hypothetical protein
VAAGGRYTPTTSGTELCEGQHCRRIVLCIACMPPALCKTQCAKAADIEAFLVPRRLRIRRLVYLSLPARRVRSPTRLFCSVSRPRPSSDSSPPSSFLLPQNPASPRQPAPQKPVTLPSASCVHLREPSGVAASLPKRLSIRPITRCRSGGCKFRIKLALHLAHFSSQTSFPSELFRCRRSSAAHGSIGHWVPGCARRSLLSALLPAALSGRALSPFLVPSTHTFTYTSASFPSSCHFPHRCCSVSFSFRPGRLRFPDFLPHSFGNFSKAAFQTQ